MKNLFFILLFYTAQNNFAQETGIALPNNKVIYPSGQKKSIFPDSSKKAYYSVLFNGPSTRLFSLYSLGIEYYKHVNKNIAFTAAFIGIVSPYHFIGSPSPVYLAFCFQPFHLLIGQKRLKFETGLSITYRNDNINNSSGFISSGYATDRVIYNFYLGLRYNFKNIPWHIHLAYVPNIDPTNHRRYYNPLFNPIGFEFGIGYILHKNLSAEKRREIRKRAKENN